MRGRAAGFTLVELLAVMAIIAMLTSIALPQFARFSEKAKSVRCMSNLRQIGIGVLGYVGDNDNTYPFIEPDPLDPVYTNTNYGAKPLFDQLSPYGVTESVLKCPADLAGEAAGGTIWFNKLGTSYQWQPRADGEKEVNPQVYGRRGGVRTANPSKLRICMDFDTVHFNRMNRLYGDGHVVAVYKDP